MSDLEQKVIGTIGKFDMFDKSERLLVCLSGGADSAALLLCLFRLGFNVRACHVNHQLRGAESDRDEAFCKDLCEKNNIMFDSVRIDVKSYCEEHGVSTELGARELRYRYFDSFDVDKICTAHTLSDSLETAVFNLARGTGLKGLCGIPPVRGRIVRPLIECTREEIEDYLSELDQDFVTDSTNLEDIYSRNKIRHRIIPVMKELNGSLYASFGQTAENLRADNDYLERLADEIFQDSKLDKGYDCKKLSAADISVRRRAVMRILDGEGINYNTKMICDVDNIVMNGGKLNISGELFAIVSKLVLTFGEAPDPFDRPECVEVSGEGSYNYAGRNLRFKILENIENIENVHKNFTYCCLDYDKINGVAVLRARQADEKIRLCNRDFTSDVRKLVNKAFRADERKGAVIIADDDGIIFVEKYGAAERVKLDPSTKRVLVFEIS